MKKEKKSLLKYRLKLLTKQIDSTREMIESSKEICEQVLMRLKFYILNKRRIDNVNR